jgi:carboxyl-terminal processing protease
MASYFLPEGEIIFTEKRGKNNEEIVYKSKGYKLLKNPEKLRLVILVNENTASAAEILAGALRDHDKAIIVGSKTFGKGSMQELINITDTMSLKVTVARWYTPKGISISGKGIVPDHIIVSDEDNTKGGIDPVFEKAIEVILSMPHP